MARLYDHRPAPHTASRDVETRHWHVSATGGTTTARHLVIDGEFASEIEYGFYQCQTIDDE